MRLERLSSENLDLFANMFRSDGSGCFCASRHAMDETWEARCKDPTKPNLQVTRRNVESGLHIGFLAFKDKMLVGWAGAGPKTCFPTMEKTRYGARLSPFVETVWAIGCLAWEKDDSRQEGFCSLTQAAILLARESGANAIEAFPVRPWDGVRAYRGSEDMYSKLGFQLIASEKDDESEVLPMRLKLRE